MKKIIILIIVCTVRLLCVRTYAQDTVSVNVDSLQLPTLTQLHYSSDEYASDRNYNYDIHNRARFYKSMGYSIMAAGPVFSIIGFSVIGMAITSTYDLPDWADLVIPLSGIVVGVGVAIPIMLAGRDLLRKGNMIEQTSYLQVSDNVSVSSSIYVNPDDRMDKGGSIGLAVKL